MSKRQTTFVIVIVIALLVAVVLSKVGTKSISHFADQVVHTQAGNVAGPMVTVPNYPRYGVTSVYPPYSSEGASIEAFDPNVLRADNILSGTLRPGIKAYAAIL
jgi:hypothetical protein